MGAIFTKMLFWKDINNLITRVAKSSRTETHKRAPVESVYKSRRSLSFVCRSFVLSFASPLKKFFRIQDVCYVTFPKDKSIQSCTLRSSKVLHKKRDKETVEKEKKIWYLMKVMLSLTYKYVSCHVEA